MKIDFRKMFHEDPVIVVNNKTQLSDGYYEILQYDKRFDTFNADGDGSRVTGDGLLVVHGKPYYTYPFSDPSPATLEDKTFRVIKRATIHFPVINVEDTEFQFVKL